MLSRKIIVDTAHVSTLRGGQSRAVRVAELSTKTRWKTGKHVRCRFQQRISWLFMICQGWINRDCSKGDVGGRVGFWIGEGEGCR